jgi:hypothetical protein
MEGFLVSAKGVLAIHFDNEKLEKDKESVKKGISGFSWD